MAVGTLEATPMAPSFHTYKLFHPVLILAQTESGTVRKTELTAVVTAPPATTAHRSAPTVSLVMASVMLPATTTPATPTTGTVRLPVPMDFETVTRCSSIAEAAAPRALNHVLPDAPRIG